MVCTLRKLFCFVLLERELQVRAGNLVRQSGCCRTTLLNKCLVLFLSRMLTHHTSRTHIIAVHNHSSHTITTRWHSAHSHSVPCHLNTWCNAQHRPVALPYLVTFTDNMVSQYATTLMYADQCIPSCSSNIYSAWLSSLSTTVTGFLAASFLRPVRRIQIRARTRGSCESKHVLHNKRQSSIQPLHRWLIGIHWSAYIRVVAYCETMLSVNVTR